MSHELINRIADAKDRIEFELEDVARNSKRERTLLNRINRLDDISIYHFDQIIINE
jgi:hypothetical protein